MTRCSATRRTIIALTAGLLGVAILPSGGSAETTLKFGLFHPANHPIIQGAYRFAEAVAERTDGEVKINVFPAGQIGGTRALEDGVRIGVVDLAQASAPTLGAIFEPASLFAMPLLFESDEHLERVVRGEIGKGVAQQMIDELGVRVLMTIFQPPSQMTSNRRIDTADDLNGLRMRVPEVPVWLAFWSHVGTNPTSIDWGELYTSLQLGVVDAQENPIVNIRAGKLYEVQNYLVLTNHVRTLNYILMNNAAFERLSPEQQEILLEEAQKADAWINETWWSQDGEAFEEVVASGIEVVEPDAASLAAAAEGFPAAYLADKEPELMKLFEDIRAAR